MTAATKEQVAEVLRAVGIRALSTDTGGGLECVAIYHGDDTLPFNNIYPVWWFGTAGETWAAQPDENRLLAGSLETGLSAETEDPRKVAAAILIALTKAVRDYPIGAPL